MAVRAIRFARRWRPALFGLVLLVFVPGCGGCSRDRGKNSDLDRPKAERKG